MQQRRRGTLTVERSLAGGPSVAPWASRSREGEERCPAASTDHRGGGRRAGRRRAAASGQQGARIAHSLREIEHSKNFLYAKSAAAVRRCAATRAAAAAAAPPASQGGAAAAAQPGRSVGPNHRLTRFSSDRAFFADLELRTLAVSRSCNDLLPAPLPAPYPPTSAARTHPETAT
jgi:hypothetical protein